MCTFLSVGFSWLLNMLIFRAARRKFAITSSLHLYYLRRNTSLIVNIFKYPISRNILLFYWHHNTKISTYLSIYKSIKPWLLTL